MPILVKTKQTEKPFKPIINISVEAGGFDGHGEGERVQLNAISINSY